MFFTNTFTKTNNRINRAWRGLACGALLALALLGLGCGPQKAAQTNLPAAVAEAVPQSWREPTGDLPFSDHLLQVIDEPALTALIDEALAENPGLAATALRLEAAGVLVKQARAQDLPRLDAGFEAGRNNQTPDPLTGQNTTAGSLQPTVSFSWELDLWGRLADHRRAAQWQRDAQEADWIALKDALVVRGVQTWIAAVNSGRMVAVQERRLAMLAEVEAIQADRYRNGLAGYEEAAAAKTQNALARAEQHAQAENQRRALRELAILLGRPPQHSPDLPAQLPAIRLTQPALPAAVLLQRPDVRAALARLETARATADAARKAQYPNLKLSSQVFRQSAQLSGLGAAETGWNLLGSLFQPILDHGALAYAARAQRLEADAAVFDVYDIVLRALGEVENALDRERSLTAQMDALAVAEQEARRNSAFFEARYRDGLDSLQSWLIAQEQEISIAMQREALQAAHLVNRIDLALAAGLGEDTRPWLARTGETHD
ncbi:TolC family protein [Acanthopleuribacter pedis]|uniref:TolC family protein n=1 Tax=Acanthopleuribacter pedis TaxID=442870 RepID=A0A8J7U6N2_9BACT|nr:TolC family protein [Acanthopleuribacter pedis]MBO1320556.1 TolC family protein [Acanthopleuribacter pedis]